MGMYTECQKELIRALMAAGCEKQPFTSKKRMESSGESRISGVLCEEEQLERCKEKRIFADQEGRKHKRVKLYNRDITYTVIIGEYSNDKLEEVYEKFIIEVPKGIYIDGNYVTFELSDAAWMDEKDHILRAKVTVQIKVTCHGGLYKDTDMARLNDIDIDVRKEE